MKKQHIVLLLSLLAPLYSVLGQVRQQPHTQHTITLSGTPIDIEWSNDRGKVLILTKRTNALNLLTAIDTHSGEVVWQDSTHIHDLIGTRGQHGTFGSSRSGLYRVYDTIGFTTKLIVPQFVEKFGDPGITLGDQPSFVWQSHNDSFLVYHDDLKGNRYKRGPGIEYWQISRFSVVRLSNDSVTHSMLSEQGVKAIWTRRLAERSRLRRFDIITFETWDYAGRNPSRPISAAASVDTNGQFNHYYREPPSQIPLYWLDDVDNFFIGPDAVVSSDYKSFSIIGGANRSTRKGIMLPSFRHRLDTTTTPTGKQLAILPLFSQDPYLVFETSAFPNLHVLSPEDNRLAALSRQTGTESSYQLAVFELDVDYDSLTAPPRLHTLIDRDSVYVGEKFTARDQSQPGSWPLLSITRQLSGIDSVYPSIASFECDFIGQRYLTSTFTFVDTTITMVDTIVGLIAPGARYSRQMGYRPRENSFPLTYFVFGRNKDEIVYSDQGSGVYEVRYDSSQQQIHTPRIGRRHPINRSGSRRFGLSFRDTLVDYNITECINIHDDTVIIGEHCNVGMGMYCDGETKSWSYSAVVTYQTNESSKSLLASWFLNNFCNASDPITGGGSYRLTIRQWLIYLGSDLPGEGLLRIVPAPDGTITDGQLLLDGTAILPSSNEIRRYDALRDTVVWTTIAPRTAPGIVIGDRHISTPTHLIDITTGEILDSMMFGTKAVICQSPIKSYAFLITEEGGENVLLYDIDNGMIVRRVGRYNGTPHMVSVSRDGDAYAVLDSNGMLSVFDLDIKDLLTSTEEGDDASFVPTLRVRPNPATFDVTIRIDSGEPTMVDIMSSEGRLVTTFPVTGSTTLPIDSLPVGYYRVVARMRNGLQSVPLVIVR